MSSARGILGDMPEHWDPADSEDYPAYQDETVDVLAIERPDRALLWRYVLQTIPFFIIPPIGLLFLIVLYFRYHTLRYQFDEQGIRMRWGCGCAPRFT